MVLGQPFGVGGGRGHLEGTTTATLTSGVTQTALLRLEDTSLRVGLPVWPAGPGDFEEALASPLTVWGTLDILHRTTRATLTRQAPGNPPQPATVSASAVVLRPGAMATYRVPLGKWFWASLSASAGYDVGLLDEPLGLGTNWARSYTRENGFYTSNPDDAVSATMNGLGFRIGLSLGTTWPME